MPFLKRLGYFLAGLSIGLIILAFLLKKKTTETGSEFCYFPNCRVLKDLRAKPLTFSDAVKEQLSSNVLDSADIQYFLIDGSVDFSKSDTKSKPCKTYVIENSLDGKEAAMHVE
ncbi:MAG: DUF4258 domain-containing protein, partial [Eudoraea sp.]|nr:DUF4258 domain-containing protein [Eudoraea sp.]